MAKKKITRKELLKKDDEFISLSNRVSRYVLTHAKAIKYLCYGLAIIIIIIIGIGLYYRNLNKKALAAYNIAYKALIGDSYPEMSEKKLQKSIEEFDKLIEDYGWTKMATLAIPQLAYLKFDQGKFDEAISLYQTYLEKDKSGSIYRSMAHFGLAAAYEAKAEYQSAIGALKNIIDGKNSFLKEEALFSLGRLYALSGQPEKSREAFIDFVEEFKNSPLLPLAKAHLR
ncbi:MAG: tetratricopeptide repeat protein [Deltaproteobacteria bacterium]|nr:tetratricopeptide repeat protein [Deltaproteobacteria bacterium]